MIDSQRTFLASGQMLQKQEGGREALSPVIELQVVIAKDVQAAYALLAEKNADFKVLGMTSLADYEQAIAKIRATLKGENTGWGLMIAPGLGV